MALPAEEAYRAAVSDINAALQGKNVEAARAALRGLLGHILVFQSGRQLAARLTINRGALLVTRQTYYWLVAGASSGRGIRLM